MEINNNKMFTKVHHGLIPALILPLIAVFGFYLVKFSKHKSISEFLYVLNDLGITEKIISLCVLPNLLLFFIFLWTNKNNSAKGVIFATLIYTILVLLSKNI